MKAFLYMVLLGGLVLSPLSSCSSDDDDSELSKAGDFNISELAGNWEATQAQFSVNTVSVDVVQEGGTVTMAVQSSGRFTLTLNPVDRSTYTVSGEMFWEEWQGTFFFAIAWDDEPGDWDTYGHTWDGTTFSINGGFDSGEYDFDNDGDAESCSLHFTFFRS